MTNYEWWGSLSDDDAKDFIMSAGFAALFGDTTVAHLEKKQSGHENEFRYEVRFNDEWKEAEHEE